MRMGKEGWLDAVLAIVGDKAGTIERAALASMTRKQLVAMEFLLVAMRDDVCQVGCGTCDWCSTKNAAAQVEYAKKHPTPIGRTVLVMPMTKESGAWVKANKATHSVLLKWEAERMTVRAPNGRQKTFGPRESCWSMLPDNVGASETK